MMRDKGIKLVGIFKPRILLRNAHGNVTAAAQYADDHKLFFDWEQPRNDYFSERPAQDIDFSKPLARSWFWDHMVPAYRSGIQYFWNDEADTDTIDNTLFPNFQNANMERAMYEGARSTGDQRVWSINRNFYLGAQRYAYAEWSGDIRNRIRQHGLGRAAHVVYGRSWRTTLVHGYGWLHGTPRS